MSLSSAGRHALLALLTALLGTAAGAQAPPPLTFADALRRAADAAPALRAQEAAADAARERAVAAAQLPDPMLRVGIANLPLDGPDRFSVTRDFMTMRNIGIAREFTREDKRRARAAGFEAEAAVALAQRDERRAALRQGAALAWFERFDLERLLTLLVQQHEESQLAVEAAERAWRGGRGTLAELLAARAERAAQGDRIAGVQAQIARASVALERYVGADAARAPLGPRPDITRLVRAPATLDALLARTPQIAALEREIARAQAEVEAARSERRTDWSGELMFSQRGPQYSNMLSFTLSVPLQTARDTRQEREVASRLAALERARAEREEALREQRARWQGLDREWASALARGAVHDSTLIPLAEQRTEFALTAWRAGSGTLGAWIEARRAELGARIERLQLDTDAARAWAQLNQGFALDTAGDTP
jgi:outer membrane protein TolC